MDRFEDVDEKTKDILESRTGRRGTISKPIIDDFLGSNKDVVKVPLEKSGSKSIMSLYLGLKSYLKNKTDINVEVLMFHNEVYLRRIV